MKNKIVGLLLIIALSAQSAQGMDYIKNNPKISTGIFLLFVPLLNYLGIAVSRSVNNGKKADEDKGYLSFAQSYLGFTEKEDLGLVKSYTNFFSNTYNISCALANNIWDNKIKIVSGGLALYAVCQDEELCNKIVTGFNSNPVLTTGAGLVIGYVANAAIDVFTSNDQDKILKMKNFQQLQKRAEL